MSFVDPAKLFAKFRAVKNIPRQLKITWLLLLALFSFMMFYRLDVKPVHHDESVNASFMKKLLDGKGYKYDPNNYHGPNLYFFQLIPTWISNFYRDGSGADGLTPFSMRSGVALSGVLLLAGILFLVPILGLWGTTLAFVLAGFSGNLLYYSRYFIHESYVLLFTLGVYLSGVYFFKTKKIRFLYLGGAAASLLFCTKETSLVTLFILSFSFVLSELTYWLLNHRRAPSPWARIRNQTMVLFQTNKLHFSLALILALFIWAVFYTSFLTNSDGLIDSFRSYLHWTKEGIESVHEKPFHYFINNILTRYDLLLIILSFVGLVAAVLRKNRHGLFLVFWTLGMVGFYSLTPYKTPWLVINIVLPMLLLSGFAFDSALMILDDSPLAVPKRVGVGAILIAVGAVFFLQLPHNMKLVYTEYDNDKHPQVYAHTSRTIFDLIERIESATKSPLGNKDISINVFVEKFWPLPYYLRDYTNVRYHKNFEHLSITDADIILVDSYRKKRLDPLLKNDYTQKYHSLRGGIPVVVYINNKFIDEKSRRPKSFLSSSVLNSPITGLTQEQYKGITFSGIRSGKKEVVSFPFSYARGEKKPYSGPFSVIWKGFIKIHTPGVYKFSLESDDGSWLYIDDTEVIDNGGEHAALRVSALTELSEGFHKIEVKYFDAGGDAVLKLYWAPPGQPEALVPSEVLFSELNK